MGQRTVERFRKRAILMHWLFAIPFFVMLVTGGIMFFDLASMDGGVQIRTIHRIAAFFLVFLPVLYLLFDHKSAIGFLREAFIWDHDAVGWLKKSLRYYFRGERKMPPQGYLNGDQKLWQLLVIVTGLLLVATGILLWFFKLKISLVFYQWALLTHAASFMVVLFIFPVHFYLTILYPGFEESLSSMIDGRISESYAREHHSKWFKKKIGDE
jgi:formate dehydrogenase subunit gamma